MFPASTEILDIVFIDFIHQFFSNCLIIILKQVCKLDVFLYSSIEKIRAHLVRTKTPQSEIEEKSQRTSFMLFRAGFNSRQPKEYFNN